MGGVLDTIVVDEGVKGRLGAGSVPAGPACSVDTGRGQGREVGDVPTGNGLDLAHAVLVDEGISGLPSSGRAAMRRRAVAT